MIAAGTRYAMGTLLRVESEGRSAEAAERARDLIFAEVERLESLLSRFRPGSELSAVNRAAGARPVSVGPETFEAVRKSLEFARASAEAFSPVADGDSREVVLDPAARTVYLPAQGSSLDLGAIGKGFALDSSMDIVRETPGLERVHIDFGGQLLFWTKEAVSGPIKVAIEDPSRPGRILADFEVSSNCSISTSSQAERPGHLIDRRSGRTAVGTASATVVAPTATEAEGWSTALFVAGAEGLAWIKSRPGVRAFLFPA